MENGSGYRMRAQHAQPELADAVDHTLEAMLMEEILAIEAEHAADLASLLQGASSATRAARD